MVAAAPEWAGRRAARLVADVERLRERPAPASAVVGGSEQHGGGDEDRVELHSLGTGRRPRAALAVGTAAALGTAERYALHSAIALLTLTTERSRSLHAAEQRIGAAVLRMLLAGEPEHARTVAGDLYGGLLDAPFRMIVAEVASASAGRAHADGHARVALDKPERPAPGTGAAAVAASGDPLTGLADVVEAAAARSGEAVLVVPDGDRLVLLAADGGASTGACTQYAEALETARLTQREQGGTGEDDELVVGLSAPAGPIAAATAYKQAEQALSVARRRGRALVEHEEVAAGSVAAAARRRRRTGLRRRPPAGPEGPRRDRPWRPRGLAARLAVAARPVGRGRRGPRRAPPHPALPDAARRGDPRPLARRPGRAHGAVAGPQGDERGRRIGPPGPYSRTEPAPGSAKEARRTRGLRHVGQTRLRPCPPYRWSGQDPSTHPLRKGRDRL